MSIKCFCHVKDLKNKNKGNGSSMLYSTQINVACIFSKFWMYKTGVKTSVHMCMLTNKYVGSKVMQTQKIGGGGSNVYILSIGLGQMTWKKEGQNLCSMFKNFICQSPLLGQKVFDIAVWTL